MASIADWVMPSETKLPESVTGVMPTATMPTIAALRRMARMLSTVRKLGVTRTADQHHDARRAATTIGEGQPLRAAGRPRRAAGHAAAPCSGLAHAAASWCITSRTSASSVHSACGLIAVRRPR